MAEPRTVLVQYLMHFLVAPERFILHLQVLIAAGAPWDVSEARNGITLLIHFARMGNTDVLRHLLELGISIHFQTTK